MNLPAAFTEVSYFDDEFRGDLIIVEDAIYFFPTRRSGYNRVYLFDGPIDRIANFLLKGILLLVTGVGVTDLWEFVANIGRVGTRGMAGTRQPDIAKVGLWHDNQTGRDLKKRLDDHIKKLDFSHRSLPKPFGLKRSEIKATSFNWRLTFKTEFDSHDFGISPFFRKRLLSALKETRLLG